MEASLSASGLEPDAANPSVDDWRDVDRQLRALARTRAGLDFEEGVWLAWRGERVDVDEEVAERAACDAQRLPGAHVSTKHTSRRASQRIPPATRRRVVRRAAGSCEVPGCRNASWTEVHHLDLRSEDGGHDADRRVVLCGAHHRLHHRGFLSIEGSREAGLGFRHADGTRYGGDAAPEAIEAAAEALSALRNFGLGETEARRAIARARAHVSTRCSTGEMVRQALLMHGRARARAPAAGSLSTSAASGRSRWPSR